MRRRPEAPSSGNEPAVANKKVPDQRRPSQAEVKGSVSYSSVLVNIGKYLLVIILVPPFLNYASLQREGQMLLPKDGQIVDVGLGQKMHLLCKGRGKPVVILDAPTGMSSDVWFHVQENVASLTKICTYDRMGLGFSKRLMQNETTGTEKVWDMSTTGRMVDDLHRLLGAAGIAGPFILVGSELGALNSRFYTHIHDVEAWVRESPSVLEGRSLLDTRWRIVCLAGLYIEDIEDIYFFSLMITGLLLIGAGLALAIEE